MIQDLDFHCYHNEYTHAQPENGDFILSFRSREILGAIRDGLLTFPTWETLSGSQNLSPSACIYLFPLTNKDISCFLIMRQKNLQTLHIRIFPFSAVCSLRSSVSDLSPAFISTTGIKDAGSAEPADTNSSMTKKSA